MSRHTKKGLMDAKKYVKHLKWLTGLKFTFYCHMPELEIGLADGDELNSSQPFLQFNVKKKIQARSYSRFDFNYWILDTASLSS